MNLKTFTTFATLTTGTYLVTVEAEHALKHGKSSSHPVEKQEHPMHEYKVVSSYGIDNNKLETGNTYTMAAILATEL